MAKDKFDEYDSTNANNTDLGGIAIQGTSYISNGDNAFREIMTHIADHFASDTIASATTTDLGSKAAHCLTVTGTTTITGLGTVKAGTLKFVTFSGALTLTYNVTSLIIPGAADITTAAGDFAIVKSLGSGNWEVLLYGSRDGGVVLRSGDAGATVGPTLTLLRASASPADNDDIGRILFQGKDDAGNTEDYAEIYGRIDDASSGTEDGALVLRTKVAGTMTSLAVLRSTGWTVNSDVLPSSDSTYDLGSSSSGWADLYVDNIKFPATQVPSADANTLDDYEEGTFTPTVLGGTSAGTYTYTAQSGNYTKIGRLVMASFQITINAVSAAGSGSLLLGGFPFDPSSTQQDDGGVFAVAANVAGVPSNFGGWVLRSSTATNSMIVCAQNTSTGAIDIVNITTMIGAGTILRGSICYWTS